MLSNTSYKINYNPDVLDCLANLSSDEVFTPPEIVNQMLDLLPQELFNKPETTFLDPATKSGVFLREIAKRLLDGLEPIISDLQTRIDHILQNQLFGIAITELTSLLARRSLYCSKYPNSRYSVTFFEDVEGNLRFKNTQHKWNNNRCAYCGASRLEYDRAEGLETHAYEFIHITRPQEIFNMKFDVIIGNPPYQLSDSGHGTSAKPIYQHFVEQAKKLKPRYLTMVIPSRWFSGGKGLDTFRHTMLNDEHLRKIIDYENFKDIFPGVDLAGGACYFLWERDNIGPCEVTNFDEKQPNTSVRNLNEHGIFIRQNKALSIVNKILKINKNKKFLSDVVSPRKPFNLPTNYQPREKGIPCWFIQKVGLKFADPSDVKDPGNYVNKWKLLVPNTPIAGQTDFSKPVGFFYDGNTRIAKPGEVCTESYIIASAFNSEKEIISFKSYLFTKVVRFLLLQTVVSQHVTRKNYMFVPDFGKYTSTYNDESLCELWDISPEEWDYIDSRIKNIGENDD